MLDIERIKTATFEELLEQAGELYEANNIISNALDLLKDRLKEEARGVVTDKYAIEYSSYSKLVPKDMSAILAKYPMDKFNDVYTISLNKNATSVIKELDLFEEQEIKKITFKKNG